MRTVGVERGQKVQVRWKPTGKTPGKDVKRVANANAKGVVKVKTAPRRGKYKVIVRSGGQVLRKGAVRVR